MAEFDVGTNSISPATKMVIEPTAGKNAFTQVSDKNPSPYKMLPRNRDMREPSRPICRDIGYWKMIIITPLMDISRPYCCGLKPM